MECIRIKSCAKSCKRMHKARQWLIMDGIASGSSKNFTKVIFEEVKIMATNKECAFNKNERCIALNCDNCDGCKFFKTPEQLSAGRAKASKMLAALPEKRQTYLRNKYGGYNYERSRH